MYEVTQASEGRQRPNEIGKWQFRRECKNGLISTILKAFKIVQKNSTFKARLGLLVLKSEHQNIGKIKCGAKQMQRRCAEETIEIKNSKWISSWRCQFMLRL
jgi:hypothetical protein